MIDRDEHIPPKVGDTVWVEGLPGHYSVLEGPNRRGELKVVRNGFSLWVAQEKLSPVAPSSQKKKAAIVRRSPASHRDQVKVERTRGAAGSAILSVDLHRHTVAEAVAAVESALDDALLRDLEWFEVVHGRGSGKLREAVHRFLASAPQVKRFILVPGNEGATKIYL